MLFLLTGSGCSGKSTAGIIAAARADAVFHDSDESGVPSDADTRWRQENLEHWVTRAIDYEGDGRDMVLTAQAPLGEVLAVPSAPRVSGIAVCLMNVADHLRRERLIARNPDHVNEGMIDAMAGWAGWHRRHAADPRNDPYVITESAWSGMQWGRWRSWSAGDERWACFELDSGGATVSDTADALAEWMRASRAELAAGRLPLAKGWDRARSDR